MNSKMAAQQGPDRRKVELARVLAEFTAKEDLLAAFCAKTKSLIEVCLDDARISYQSVQARVKSKKKLIIKYKDPRKDYRNLNDITDLVGLRIITYYEDDVDRVAEVIRREFQIDDANSVDKRRSEPDKFSYSAINYVCSHAPKRISDVEYKRFSGIRCEIQITSILRHAWSEMEHEWYDLKDAYPHEVKRRFSRILALLELAESEFLSMRNARAEFQQFVASQQSQGEADLPVNTSTMKSFIQREPVLARLDRAVAAKLGGKLLDETPDTMVGATVKIALASRINNIGALKELLRKYYRAVPEYAVRYRNETRGSQPMVLLARGSSIFYLCLMLANIRGVRATRKFSTITGIALALSPNRQHSIAKAVLAKCM